ncbi:hypothetical protein B0H14DRAFT_3476857 [Mycena olivaceomarginata]|nr:hypothetical protein B0H14DRAFT_3476857 [Mycena olivaceomarginata]
MMHESLKTQPGTSPQQPSMPEHACNCSTASVLQTPQVWVIQPLVDGLQRWWAPESAAPNLTPRERCVCGLRTRESLFSNLKLARPALHSAGAQINVPLRCLTMLAWRANISIFDLRMPL